MTLTELRRAVEDKANKLSSTISNFDLDFLAHVYLACLYIHKLENRVPIVLDNIQQLIPMGAILYKNRSALSEELKDFIPTDGVPLKRELDDRWVANQSLKLDTEELKPRVQELIKSIG